MADSSKTEDATPKKQLKAREQGQIARSRELPGILAFAGVLGVITMMAPTAITHWTVLYRNTLYAAASGDIEANGPVLFWSSVEVMRWVYPALLAGLVLSILAGFAQGGVNFAPEALSLKFNRLSPASKLAQLFSPMGLSNLLKSLLPFSAMMWIVITIMRSHWGAMVHASALGSRMFADLVGSMIFELIWKSGLVLVAWSAVDYLLTLKKINSDLKMSKQEVREEYKETDGNPVIKSRIRQLQKAMRRRRSLAPRPPPWL
jgi:flagellar biosynthetic protein FlhB